MKNTFQRGDAFLSIDLINAFGKDGELVVPGAEEILEPHNTLVKEFIALNLPVFAAVDRHPKVSKHFKEFGGPWDEHGVENTWSAEFLPGFYQDSRIQVVPKGTTGKDNGYSGFDDTLLHTLLQAQGVKRLFVDGVATNFCVIATVSRALELGYEVIVLTDLIRAIDINSGDGDKALQEMQNLGAMLMSSTDLPIVEV